MSKNKTIVVLERALSMRVIQSDATHNPSHDLKLNMARIKEMFMAAARTSHLKQMELCLQNMSNTDQQKMIKAALADEEVMQNNSFLSSKNHQGKYCLLLLVSKLNEIYYPIENTIQHKTFEVYKQETINNKPFDIFLIAKRIKTLTNDYNYNFNNLVCMINAIYTLTAISAEPKHHRRNSSSMRQMIDGDCLIKSDIASTNLASSLSNDVRKAYKAYQLSTMDLKFDENEEHKEVLQDKQQAVKHQVNREYNQLSFCQRICLSKKTWIKDQLAEHSLQNGNMMVVKDIVACVLDEVIKSKQTAIAQHNLAWRDKLLVQVHEETRMQIS